MICAYSGPKGTESTCNGDSGGPLVVQRGGKYVHVGLTSFGLVDCTSPFPTVYARTTYVLDWISAVISSTFS
jgi:trypsin